jgi:hypothetical protein
MLRDAGPHAIGRALELQRDEARMAQRAVH